MPHLRFRSVHTDTVRIISAQAQELARVVQTSADNFTFELISTQFFEAGTDIRSYPFVEVLWFPRTQELKQKTADFLTEQIKKAEGAVDVCVVFTEIQKDDYFENGKSFGGL